ncbi:pantetheine-phosphate adenylyltransferase [Gammaproteobacteria bacterium]|jgi:pantetheine-phosphate adenylyltransferase|nr:pantetheine-phosphate adenylyltransferase [Gammaproteobacteria bacterium]|tara:strand:+ start:751 stop:1227 length:477 start_codon:yes stop_codon:yes gene_type:complete
MIAVYPGTFDPITNGHFEIIRRASTLFETLLVAVASSPEKSPLFDIDERLHMVNEVLNAFSNIEVKKYSGLTIDFAKQSDAHVIVRGLRSPADGQYEFELASMNKRLADDIETIFLSSGDQNAFISSSLIRQIAQEGGDITGFVHPVVQSALNKKYSK